ncbi:MAG: hypothetical protein HQM08_07085 [Candidatus Riflebacteria bacterium]|nr:hypothetical protein [Candidatus Riflebacteria bacterium]
MKIFIKVGLLIFLILGVLTGYAAPSISSEDEEVSTPTKQLQTTQADPQTPPPASSAQPKGDIAVSSPPSEKGSVSKDSSESVPEKIQATAGDFCIHSVSTAMGPGSGASGWAAFKILRQVGAFFGNLNGKNASKLSNKLMQKDWEKAFFNKIRKMFSNKSAGDMQLWEKIAWTVGRSLIPTLGVMVATACLAPLSPVAVIIGGIAVGALLGGLTTFAYDKRMNHFTNTPEDDKHIWRDVAVQATVEGVMAPFNLATGCLCGMVGQSAGAAIYKIFATQAAVSFAGAGLSSVAGGLVKHAWATEVFQYPEKIKADQDQINKILYSHVHSNTPLSDAETAKLNSLRSDIDNMKGQDYSPADFKKDMESAAVTAAISGFAGPVLSEKLYQPGEWADSLSLKVFGTTAQGRQISGLFTNLPANFVSGAAQGELQKSFISSDIEQLKKQQANSPAGTAAYQYYANAIQQNEAKRNSVNVAQSGVDSMISNFTIRSTQLSVQALQYNLYDGPKARSNAISSEYRKNDPDWQKASDLYDKYQDAINNNPSPSEYKNPLDYTRAQAQQSSIIETSRKAWIAQCIVAQANENEAENQAKIHQISQTYDKQLRLNQLLELGQIRGGQAYTDAMKEVLKAQNPELANKSDDELNQLAYQAILKTYSDKQTECDTNLQQMDDTLNKYKNYKSGDLTLADKDAQVLTGKALLIAPSQYKAQLVQKQVYDLKGQGFTWDEVSQKMPQILSTAESQTFTRFGGNWNSLLVNEMYANGLAKYKYDPEGKLNVKDSMDNVKSSVTGLVKQGIISDYTEKTNNALISSLIPANSASQSTYENSMKTFAKPEALVVNSNLFSSIFSAGQKVFMGAFSKF